MIELNEANGASNILGIIQSLVTAQFPEEKLVGIEMGIAYGGGIEKLGMRWKGKGEVYGYDTFEGQPKELAWSPDCVEAKCLDTYYQKHGMDALSYDFIQGELDKQGIDNVHLVKGLVCKNSCVNLKEIHYAFLDMDIYKSMKVGYEAVKDKIVSGGFLCLHDVCGAGFPSLFPWYAEIKDDGMWTVVYEGKGDALAVLVKTKKVIKVKTKNESVPSSSM